MVCGRPQCKLVRVKSHADVSWPLHVAKRKRWTLNARNVENAGHVRNAGYAKNARNVGNVENVRNV